MSRAGDYNVCITARHDDFAVNPDDISRLIDYFDTKMYLDGPDREHSRLVVLSHAEARTWKPFIRTDPDAPVEFVRRRQVHILHSPAASEEQFRNYGQLLQKLDNLTPKDTPFVASLGLASRRLYEILYCPVPGQAQHWIDLMTVHVVQGYHPVWRRIWDEQQGRKDWQMLAAKSFILMFSCRVNGRVDHFTIEEYLEVLRLKAEFVEFLREVGSIIGTKDFELLGGTTE
jgi:hypothetical protein